MFSFSEEVYKTNLPINYVLEKGVINTDYLVIIFSGFNSPEAEIQHSYNYMKTLQSLNCNKLFILDNYGPRGCYYLGKNMSFEVETLEFLKGNFKFKEVFLGKEIIGLNYFKFNSTEISLINNKIHFALLLHEYQKLDYAYYIIKDEKVLKKIWYYEKKEITYEPIESGQYQIMFFIRTRDGYKIIDKSNIIEVK